MEDEEAKTVDDALWNKAYVSDDDEAEEGEKKESQMEPVSSIVFVPVTPLTVPLSVADGLMSAEEVAQPSSEKAMATVMASAVTAEPPVAEAAAMQVEMEEVEEKVAEMKEMLEKMLKEQEEGMVVEEEAAQEAAPQEAIPTSNVVPLPPSTAEQARSQPQANALEARKWIGAWREKSVSSSAPAAAAANRGLVEEAAAPEEEESPAAAAGGAGGGGGVAPEWSLAGALSVVAAIAAAVVLSNGAPEGLQIPEVSKILPDQVLTSTASKAKATVAEKATTTTELLLQNYKNLNAEHSA